MPESRDRLVRPLDYAALFARRRSSTLQILAEDTADVFGSPIRQQQQQEQQQQQRAAVTTVLRTPARFGDTVRGGGGGGVGITRGGFGTPRARISRGRSSFGSAAAAVNRENTPAAGSARRGRGRGRNGALPYWYPRTPLRDITAITRAFERRRARLREDEGQGTVSPAPQEQGPLDPLASISVAPLEHNILATSPRSAFRRKPCPPSVGKISKILLGVANQTTAESEFLTPQKRLLNSIDTVEKVVMEELQKLKRTPSAKKAEREQRVKTLMSMR